VNNLDNECLDYPMPRHGFSFNEGLSGESKFNAGASSFFSGQQRIAI